MVGLPRITLICSPSLSRGQIIGQPDEGDVQCCHTRDGVEVGDQRTTVHVVRAGRLGVRAEAGVIAAATSCSAARQAL